MRHFPLSSMRSLVLALLCAAAAAPALSQRLPSGDWSGAGREHKTTEEQLAEIQEKMGGYLKDSNEQNRQRAQDWINLINAANSLEGDQKAAALEDIVGIYEDAGKIGSGWGDPRRLDHLRQDMQGHIADLDAAQVFQKANVDEKAFGAWKNYLSPGGSQDGGASPQAGNPATWGKIQDMVGPNPAVSQGLANSLAGAGDYNGAVAAANQAIEMAPNYPAPYVTKSQSLEKLGDYAGANEAAKQALRLEPGNPLAATIARLTEGRQGPTSGQAPSAGAKPEGTPFFQGDPSGMPRVSVPAFKPAGNPSVGRLVEKATSLIKQKDYAAAAEAAARAIALDPTDVSSRYLHILSLMRMKRFDEAMKAADEAVRAAPGYAELWTARAKLRNLRKDYPGALADARQALQLKPGSAEAHIQFAWASGGLGRRAEALDHLRQAAQLNPAYRSLYEKAQALKDGDLALLLGGQESEGAPAPAPGGASLPLGLSRRTAAGLGCVLFAGLLLGFAFHRFSSGRGAEELQRTVGALTRTGPAVAEAKELPGLNGDGTGQTIGGAYRVVRQLGLGGMGVVYEAVDTALERKVAIKKMREEIRSDPRERERFIKEARMVASLHHPNIVDIFNIFEAGNDAYLVFEYVDGKTLHEIVRSRGKLSLPEALGLAEGIAAALDYAHSREMIHRDLKPSNVMLSRERTVKVMDFGVARQAKDSLTRLSMTNTVVGTPPYMAPEQEQGVVSKGCDIYALAICVYEMLTGELPFSGVGAGMLLAKMNKTYVPASRKVSGLPAGLDAVFDKAFEPDPKDRWRSAGEFIARLKSLTSPAGR